jgi:hypothetical protein
MKVKYSLKLYKEFVEENGLEAKMDKWVKGRETSKKFKFTLGKLVPIKDLQPGTCYYTGEIDPGGPEAWIYDGAMHLTIFGEFISTYYAKKAYEIPMGEFEKYVNYYIEKRYGKKYAKSLKNVK